MVMRYSVLCQSKTLKISPIAINPDALDGWDEQKRQNGELAIK